MKAGGDSNMFVFEKNRAVLGSVIITHLSYRLFRVHIFKCLVVNRWLVGVNVQKHSTSHSSCLGAIVVMEGDPGQEDHQDWLWLPWVWDVLTSSCSICLVTFGERVDLM